MSSYLGACHCGACRIEYRTGVPLADWPLRRCACDYCRRVGARYTSDPEGELALSCDPAPLRYRFALERADFLSCVRCGSYLGALRRDADDQRMVLNANLLDLAEDLPPEPQRMDYDGESEETRDGRQRARWTPARVDMGEGRGGGT